MNSSRSIEEEWLMWTITIQGEADRVMYDLLAPMHAPAFAGDCRRALLDLADDFEARLRRAS